MDGMIVATHYRIEEVNARFEKLKMKYRDRESLPQLVAEGYNLIKEFAPSESEMQKCNKVKNLMLQVLTLNEPLGRFYESIDRKINELTDWLLQINPIAGNLYAELYHSVCDSVFSEYVARAEAEIEITPKFQERVESEARIRGRNYAWTTPFLSAPPVDFEAERKYGKRKGRKK